MIQQIWNKKVICVVEMEEKDCADERRPLPLIIPASWNHYIGFYFQEIQNFFMAYRPYPYTLQQFWLEMPSHSLHLNGTQIIGIIYSLYSTNNAQPLSFVCHFRKSKPACPIDLKKHFKQTLKASTSIRYGKFGASVITVEMSVNNIEDMFINFQKSNYEKYLGSVGEEDTDLGYRFILSKQDKIDKVPVRVIGKDWLIERSVEKTSELGVFLTDLVGNEPIRLHGILLEIKQIKFQFFERYCHPDGFLYLTV